jgi:hypothetical protein
MPLGFNGTSSVLTSLSAFRGVTFDTPITMMGWIKTNQITRIADLCGISAAAGDYESLGIDGATGGDPSRNRVNDQGVSTVTVFGPNAPGTGVWIQLAATTNNTGTSRTVYTNNVAGSASGTSGGIATLTNLYLGSFFDWHDGDIMNFGVWNEELSVAEITSHFRGFPASRIRPQSIRAYYPGIRATVQRMSAAIQPTATNVSYSDNPARIYGM